MSLLMTAVFENGFQEIYLPNINNKNTPIDIRPHISGWKEDITLPLQVWDDVWQLAGSRQFIITRDERQLETVELKPGLLLNCELCGSSQVFSVTVDEVDEGHTNFGKYLLDFTLCPWIKVGSGEGNIARYGNQFCSPQHAEIVREDGRAVVRDLNSVNGTFVNGRRLSGDYTLKYGDVIYIVGLKIVYLGNVLAINNPKGSCTVDNLKLKAIHIELSGGAEEEHDYEAEENYFLRTPRKVEKLDDETFIIEKVPPRNRQKRQPMIFTVGPAVTIMIPMIAGSIMMSGSGGGASIAGGLTMSVGAALIGGLWAFLNIRYQDKDEAQTESTRLNTYNAYIAKASGRLQAKADYSRQVLYRMLPDAADVSSFPLEGSSRLWEKSSTHDDFLTIRLGIGSIPSPNKIEVPKEQLMAEHDPLNDKVEDIYASMSSLRQVPVGISLYSNRSLGIVSLQRAKAINLCSLLGAQLAGLHPYTDVRLCYVYSMREADSFDYIRWLPHVWTPDGKMRMIANDKNTVGDVMYYLSSVVRERLETAADKKEENVKLLPHYVVIVADWSLVEDEPIAKYLMNPQPELGITVVFLVDAIDKLPSGCTAIVQDDADQRGYYSTLNLFPAQETVDYDTLGLERMEEFARSLSNYKVRELNVSTTIPDTLSFLDMYKLSRLEDLNMLHRWLENRTYESMKSMIGYKSGNQPLYLDIHEKYHGPHGLVAGTTGSGKSETLQSYILSLVVNYHPHEVAFIIIDYKGGGMAQSLVGLPHLSGVITNLGGNATNRALLSINAEIKSRQRIFNEHKVKHIDAYIELYRSGVASEPMPHLLIIADEFAELKKEQPEFVRALVSAARVGRSLGVNLILATQKPSGVVDDEIWSNTRFRLCLRVADKQDSNEMLKRPDAAAITGTGRGYFQVGNDEIFEEFQSGWSGAEYEPEIAFSEDKNAKVEYINIIGKNAVPKKKSEKKSDNIAKLTQLDALVKYAAQLAEENSIPAIKPIWMPPLPKSIYLEDLPEMPKPQGFSLLLPLGLVDNPDGQNQYPCAVDFIADGHLLVCGSGGSGRTTLLQTIIYSAITRYSSEEVNIYIVDFSSRTMGVFSDLPQVGGVFIDGEDEKIAEVFEFLQESLARRKRDFSKQGIGSFKEYVTQNNDCPAIIFIIDNYVAFIENYEQYEDTIAQLSREAASYGIYLVPSMNNSGELRSRIRQNFITGIALQMPDRFEYEAVVGDRTEIIPEGRTPGRGLIKAPLPVEFQVALCVKEDEGLSQAQTLRRRFAALKPPTGAGVKKIGDKLEHLSYAELITRADVQGLPENILALGLDQESLKLVTVNLDEEFCYTISGAGSTGKTNLLAAVAKQTAAQGLRLFLFDHEGGELEGISPFERVVHNDVELFDLMEQIITTEFTTRNGAVNDARDAGGSVTDAMAGYQRIIFLVNDMRAFISAIYSPQREMGGFFEVALEKGREHKIHFFAAVTPDDRNDMARYAAMRIWAGWGRGLHLGGMFDQQNILRFDLSAADNVRSLPPGIAYAPDQSGTVVKLVTPQVLGMKEAFNHE